MIKNICIILSLCLCLFGKTQAQTASDVHQLWDQILSEHIVILDGGHATQFDYQAVANKPQQLEAYLQLLSSVTKADFEDWSKPRRLAFLINAYNAFTVKWIVDQYPLDSIRDTGSFFSSPWSKKFISLLGQTVSLDTIEHQWIRGGTQFNEPRIHFAVNCASVGCPALREEAYRAEKLDAQLESQTRRFMSDRSRNYAKGNEIYLSAIFDWYEDDFEQGWLSINNLYQFVLKYKNELSLTKNQIRAAQNMSADIGFLKYDWSLNDIKTR